MSINMSWKTGSRIAATGSLATFFTTVGAVSLAITGEVLAGSAVLAVALALASASAFVKIKTRRRPTTAIVAREEHAVAMR